LASIAFLSRFDPSLAGLPAESSVVLVGGLPSCAHLGGPNCPADLVPRGSAPAHRPSSLPHRRQLSPGGHLQRRLAVVQPPYFASRRFKNRLQTEYRQWRPDL